MVLVDTNSYFTIKLGLKIIILVIKTIFKNTIQLLKPDIDVLIANKLQM